MISHMEELLAERNPLYGRKTLALDLAPSVVPRCIAICPPGCKAEDKLVTAGVFGGIPFYLQLLDQGATLQNNIIRLLLDADRSLVDEPVVLLQSELREVSKYASVLAAISRWVYQARRNHRQSQGAERLPSIGPLLGEARAHAVDPHRQVDGRLPEGARPPLLHCRPAHRNSWYRFVQPNLSSVTQSFGAEVWRHQIAPKLDEFMGGVFEEICREHARRFSQEYFSAPAQEIGRIWQADYDIDVAGKLLDGSMLYGGVQVVDRPSLAKISSTNSSSAHPGPTTVATITSDILVLYARTGFTTALQRRAATQPGIVLHIPQTMLRNQESGPVR